MSFQKSNPKISIILPVYNVAPYIVECLDSIVSQTFTDFELLIIDDVSADNTMEIIQQYLISNQPECIIKIITHEKNKGLSAARNTGIEAAEGDNIVFVDSDDWVAKDMLQNFIIEANQYPLSVICGNAVEVNDGVQSPYWSSDVRLVLHKNEAIERMLVYDKVIDTAWAKMIPRVFFTEFKIRFPENLYYEDTPTNVRIFNHCSNVIVINQNVYYYRRNRVGSILYEKSFRSASDRLVVFDNIYNYLISETTIDKEFALNYYLNRMTFEYRLVLTGYELNVSQQKNILNKISNVVNHLSENYGNLLLKKKIGIKFNLLMKRSIYKSAFLFLLFHNSIYSILRFLVEDI